MPLELIKISQKSLPILFAVFLGIVFLLVDPLAYHSFTALKNLVVTVGVSIFLVWLITTSKKIELGWIALLFALRIVWLALSNPDWLLHPSNDGFYLSISLLGVLIVSQNLDQKKFFAFFLWGLLVLGITQACIGVYQLAMFIPNASVPIKTPFIGTFGTSNGLGIFLVLSAISGISLSYKHRNLLLYASTLIVLVGLVLTESRGSVLAFLIVFSIVLGIIFYQKIQNALLKRALIGSIMLAIFLSSFFLYRADMESSSGRWMIWEITALMVQDNPVFGVGHGNYSREYLNYQAVYFEDESHAENIIKAANIKQAHNEFLQSLAEGGLGSGVLLFAIWTFPFVQIYRDRKGKYSVSDLTKPAMVSAIVLHSLIDSPLHVLPVAIAGYAIIGTIDKNLFVLSRWSKYVLFFLVSIYCVFISVRKINTYSGHRFWKNGVEHIQKKQWKLAINDFEVALERLPQKGELQYQLGAAYVFDGQYSRGIYFINESKKNFNDRNIYLSESYGLIQLEKFEEAKEKALVVLAMFPAHLAPHLLLGEIYYNLGDIELSKESLKKCITEDIEIKSIETKQISEEAKELWERFHEKL